MSLHGIYYSRTNWCEWWWLCLSTKKYIHWAIIIN